MAGTKDIKDFTKFPSLSDNDYLLGTKTDLGGTDAGITVGDLKKQVASDAAPLINENGYWVVNGLSTGEKARGETPVLNGGMTTTGEEETEAWSEVVPDGLTSEGAPKYKLNLILPRGTTGKAGKTAIFGIGNVSNGDKPSATLISDGEDESGNPKYKLNITLPVGETGENGKTPKFEAGKVLTLDPGQPASAEINFKQYDTDRNPIYMIYLSIPKGDIGETGKTPVLGMVNAQFGDTPSGGFVAEGIDESGNPKYILDLTLPAGKDGQPAIFEQGRTLTVEPTESANVEIIENGFTTEGNPKYILNFYIPRGQTGKPGEGSGNVSADSTGLIIGKKYLFVPDSDDSTSGSFVEYVAPEILEQIPSDWEQTDPNAKNFIKNKPIIPDEYDDTDIRAEIEENLQAAKDYTNEQIGSIVQFDIVVVESLPGTGVKGTIFLVPKDGSNNDVHDEYIWVEDTGGYELIGSTSVDLSDYYTCAQSDNTFVKKEARKRLMTDTEGAKLEGIEEGANNYVLPTGEGYNFIPVGGEAGKALVWESPGQAQWGSVSGFDPMILGSVLNLKSSTDQVVFDKVLNGNTFDDLVQAFENNRIIFFKFLDNNNPGYALTRSVYKSKDGNTSEYFYFDIFYYHGRTTPCDRCIRKTVFMNFNPQTKLLKNIYVYGKLETGYQLLDSTEIPFNGGTCLGFLNISNGFYNPVLTFPWGASYEGDETNAILINSHSSPLTIQSITLSADAPNGTRIVLVDELSTLEKDYAVEINIKFTNYVFIVRISQPFKYS